MVTTGQSVAYSPASCLDFYVGLQGLALFLGSPYYSQGQNIAAS